MLRVLKRLLVAMCLGAVALASSAEAQRANPPRVGLVIGNAKYPDGDYPLTSSTEDARFLAAELKSKGFVVSLGENLSRSEMKASFDRFVAGIQPGSAVLLYFSGYGVQSGRKNYLIPVDAQIWAETDVQRAGFELNEMLAEIDRRNPSSTVVVLDAAHRNPFERRFRTYSNGLAPIASLPRPATLMYSTSPGKVLARPGGG
ncbi:MAG: peptidase caspase catalytic subunit p20, partial [Enterovirga sp.]|nr:peptidase caspase catalytic subunit p20 [Enterovirga sp.]